MLPTINTAGDFIVVEKWTHLSKRGYQVGDIVQGRHPYENHPVCKRIIGKVGTPSFGFCNWEGGDIIRPDISSREVIRVPKGHVWIQGDNLSNSIDSRNYGAVPEATLKGRVLARVIAPFLAYFIDFPDFFSK
jgi:mitochondrial inner membrane protease subunit 1